jgi:hypothetical protein
MLLQHPEFKIVTLRLKFEFTVHKLTPHSLRQFEQRGRGKGRGQKAKG